MIIPAYPYHDILNVNFASPFKSSSLWLLHGSTI